MLLKATENVSDIWHSRLYLVVVKNRRKKYPSNEKNYLFSRCILSPTAAAKDAVGRV